MCNIESVRDNGDGTVTVLYADGTRRRQPAPPAQRVEPHEVPDIVRYRPGVRGRSTVPVAGTLRDRVARLERDIEAVRNREHTRRVTDRSERMLEIFRPAILRRARGEPAYSGYMPHWLQEHIRQGELTRAQALAYLFAIEAGALHRDLQEVIATGQPGRMWRDHPAWIVVTGQYPIETVPTPLQRAIDAGLVTEVRSGSYVIADDRGMNRDIVQMGNRFPGFTEIYSEAEEAVRRSANNALLAEALEATAFIALELATVGAVTGVALIARVRRMAEAWRLGRAARGAEVIRTADVPAGAIDATRRQPGTQLAPRPEAALARGDEAVVRPRPRAGEAVPRAGETAPRAGETAPRALLGPGAPAQPARSFTPQQRAALRAGSPPSRPQLLEEFFTRYPKLSLDADTIHEARLLFGNTRRSEGLFTHSRAASGEMRVLDRVHASAAVSEIRFPRALGVAGGRFPDMRIRIGGQWYDLEVRSYTAAPRGALGRPRGQALPQSGNPNAAQAAEEVRLDYDRAQVAAGLREKIRHGQVNGGVVVVNMARPPARGGPPLTARQLARLQRDLENPAINTGLRVRELWLVWAQQRVQLVAELTGSNIYRRVFGAP
jgi:hypothetical protein